MITLKTTAGDITVELFDEQSPQTCENFRQYAKNGFYEGTIFHRVIKGFMVQGGGFTSAMEQRKPGAPIPNEADNGLSNKTGTLAMARTSDPHSASSQFFINAKDNTFLDFKSRTTDGWGYCVFGRVVDGMDAVRTIENVKTTSRAGHRDVPAEPVAIEKVEIQDD